MLHECKLITMKHSKNLLPVLLIAVLMCGIRLVYDDNLIIMQIHSILLIISECFVCGYTLYYLNSLIGLGQDKLILMSPKPKFTVLLLSTLILVIFMMLNFILFSAPMLLAGKMSFILLTIGKRLLSMLAGIGTFMLFTLILKGTNNKLLIKYVPWIASIIITLVVSIGTIGYLDSITSSELNWLVGSSLSTELSQIYLGLLVINVDFDGSIAFISILNFAFCVVTWSLIYVLMKRMRINYLELY
ncbi:MAG: hypothetical protein ACRDD4_10265 [Culicoidibacterales bacterium]